MQFIKRWAFSTNNKAIGTLYFIFGAFFGIFLSFLMQLFYPSNQLYNVVVTALVILFFMGMVILKKKFGDWFIPLMLKAPINVVMRRNCQKRNEGTLGIIFMVVVLSYQAYTYYKYGKGDLSIEFEFEVDLDRLNAHINTITKEKNAKIAVEVAETLKLAKREAFEAFEALQRQNYNAICEPEAHRLRQILAHNVYYNVTKVPGKIREAEIDALVFQYKCDLHTFSKGPAAKYHAAIVDFSDID